MSLREELLEQQQNLHKEPIKAFGKDLFVRVWTAKERDAFEIIHHQGKLLNHRATITQMSLCDEDGKLVFEPGDIDALGNMPAYELDPIAECAIKLNKYTTAEIEQLKKS